MLFQPISKYFKEVVIHSLNFKNKSDHFWETGRSFGDKKWKGSKRSFGSKKSRLNFKGLDDTFLIECPWILIIVSQPPFFQQINVNP